MSRRGDENFWEVGILRKWKFQESRRTSIIELFSIGVSKNIDCAISDHKSTGGYYVYAKPTDNHKREALANVLNKIITTEELQNLIEDSNSESDNTSK
ncbi:28921_t:CDS:2, partial [Dentiscutata erythropus]